MDHTVRVFSIALEEDCKSLGMLDAVQKGPQLCGDADALSDPNSCHVSHPSPQFGHWSHSCDLSSQRLRS
jgi:hypothetical protein